MCIRRGCSYIVRLYNDIRLIITNVSTGTAAEIRLDCCRAENEIKLLLARFMYNIETVHIMLLLLCRFSLESPAYNYIMLLLLRQYIL